MTAALTILLLNGPNLGRLGVREPSIYGSETLSDIEARMVVHGKSLGIDVVCFQSNHEGALIDRIENGCDAGVKGCIINPGAFTHSSYALLDAIRGSALPVVEVHLSNIYAREAFREHSLTARACLGVISGLGSEGYLYALEFLARKLRVS